MSDVELQALNLQGGNYRNDNIKLGDKCCGCCCDTRRATIILSILGLTFSALNVVALIGAEAIREKTHEKIDDDILIDTVEKTYFIQAILESIEIFTSLACLIGGIKYNIYLVGVHIGYMVLQYIISTSVDISAFIEIKKIYHGMETINYPWTGFVISAIVLGFIIYPMVRFIKEVKLGIMSPETYPREEYSCCCTPKRN
jgi:hypothetical protein